MIESDSIFQKHNITSNVILKVSIGLISLTSGPRAIDSFDWTDREPLNWYLNEFVFLHLQTEKCLTEYD